MAIITWLRRLSVLCLVLTVTFGAVLIDKRFTGTPASRSWPLPSLDLIPVPAVARSAAGAALPHVLGLGERHFADPGTPIRQSHLVRRCPVGVRPQQTGHLTLRPV
jgi:hypothetical protein